MALIDADILHRSFQSTVFPGTAITSLCTFCLGWVYFKVDENEIGQAGSQEKNVWLAYKFEMKYFSTGTRCDWNFLEAPNSGQEVYILKSCIKNTWDRGFCSTFGTKGSIIKESYYEIKILTHRLGPKCTLLASLQYGRQSHWFIDLSLCKLPPPDKHLFCLQCPPAEKHLKQPCEPTRKPHSEGQKTDV